MSEAKVLPDKLTLLVCIVLYLLTGCQQTSRNVRIDNQHSVLLAGLLQETDFSKEWKWKISILEQVSESPNAANDYLLERAHLTLNGYVNNHRFLIIRHALRRYEVNSENKGEVKANMTAQMELFGGDYFFISLVNYGQETSYWCAQKKLPGNELLTSCFIGIDYEHIISVIETDYRGNFSREEIEEQINQLLKIVDSRLSGITPSE